MWFNGPNYATMRQAEEDAKETPTNDGFSAILDLPNLGSAETDELINGVLVSVCPLCSAKK